MKIVLQTFHHDHVTGQIARLTTSRWNFRITTLLRMWWIENEELEFENWIWVGTCCPDECWVIFRQRFCDTFLLWRIKNSCTGKKLSLKFTHGFEIRSMIFSSNYWIKLSRKQFSRILNKSRCGIRSPIEAKESEIAWMWRSSETSGPFGNWAQLRYNLMRSSHRLELDMEKLMNCIPYLPGGTTCKHSR